MKVSNKRVLYLKYHVAEQSDQPPVKGTDATNLFEIGFMVDKQLDHLLWDFGRHFPQNVTEKHLLEGIRAALAEN